MILDLQSVLKKRFRENDSVHVVGGDPPPSVETTTTPEGSVIPAGTMVIQLGESATTTTPPEGSVVPAAPPTTTILHEPSAEELEALRAKYATTATLLGTRYHHDRDDRIFMDEEKHLYYIDGVAGRYQSVTTFIHELFPPFDREASARTILRSKSYLTSQSREQYEYHGMSKEEIWASWEEASRLGTEMHAKIEHYWNESYDVFSEEAMQIRELGFFRSFLADFPHLRAYRTEWMVFHEELRLSGSIDMVFQDPDGEEGVDVWIYDWKRCKNIRKPYPSCDPGSVACTENLKNVNVHHYSLQLNLYKYILETKYGKRVTHMCLLFLHPNQKTYKRIVVEDWSTSYMPDILAHRIASLN